MGDRTRTPMSAMTSLLVVLLIAVVGGAAFFIVFEMFGANGYISAGIFLAILAVSALVETFSKRK